MTLTQVRFFQTTSKDGGSSTEINDWLNTHSGSVKIVDTIITPLMNSGTIYGLSVCIVYEP